MQWYLDLLSHIKSKFPQINIHGFSPSEFIHFREVFGLPLEEIISQFVQGRPWLDSRRRRRNSRRPRPQTHFPLKSDERRLARKSWTSRIGSA